MYVVVRGDLPPGLQCAQSVHAAFLFALEHPRITRDWHQISEYVVVLNVPDRASLVERYDRLPNYAGRSMFYEADLDGEPTAFAVLGSEAGRVLSDLPLAMKEPAMV